MPPETEDVLPEPTDKEELALWQERNERIEAAQIRCQKFMDCLVLLSYDDAADKQAELWQQVEPDLERCDLCIRKYHMGKEKLYQTLTEEYDEEAIQHLFDAINARDVTRISAGLDTARDKLLPLPEKERKKTVIGPTGLSVIYESLTCKAFLEDKDKMAAHFDEPFQLVQTVRPLRLGDILPGTVRFLFDKNEYRNNWALVLWGKRTDDALEEEFDFSIKYVLDSEAKRVSLLGPPEYPDATLFWRGVSLILKSLSPELMKDRLPSLNVDLPRLILDYLHIRTSSLCHILDAMTTLLRLVPALFWDAAQAASPKLIIQTIFMNDEFRDLMTKASPETLPGLLAFIPPFLLSLPRENQAAACQEILRFLWEQIQANEWAPHVKHHAFEAGLQAVTHVLESYYESQSSANPIPRAILSEMLSIVAKHAHILLTPVSTSEEDGSQHLSNACLDVVRRSLLLECNSLKLDYIAIFNNKPLLRGKSSHSAQLWNVVISSLSETRHDLTCATLKAIMPLVGLEKFESREALSADKEQFNATYGEISSLVARIFEKIADFKAPALSRLFETQDACTGLTFGLVSADPATYNSAIDLFKNFSGNPVRKDAIGQVIDQYFVPITYAFGESVNKIAEMKTFESAPRMVKTAIDMSELLCDPQSGLLRFRDLEKKSEIEVIRRLWENLWKALKTIFEQTETWHDRGKKLDEMLPFCRDTMQLADYLVDQYDFVAGKLREGSKDIKIMLLGCTNKAMNGMVKWSRLKDAYLAVTLSQLVAKVLGRFRELEITVAPDVIDRLGRVADATTRTVLTGTERANLAQALSEYNGDDLVEITKEEATAVKPAKPTQKLQPQIAGYFKQADTGLPSSATNREKNAVLAEMQLRQIRQEAQRSRMIREEAAKAKVQAEQKKQADFISQRKKDKEEQRRRDLENVARTKARLQGPSSGSALTGLGVTGKDHAQPKADSMMVSSESESDDDDDEISRQLGITKTKKTPEMVKYVDDVRAGRIKAQGPVKKNRLVRSQRDLRARIAPDLGLLHRQILGWDFFADTDLPPNSDRTDYSLVTNTFRDPREYQGTFNGLLLLEAWQGFRTAREEANAKTFTIKVSNKMSVDSFVEINANMDANTIRELGGVGESDILLLSRSETPLQDANVPHCFARVQRINYRGQNRMVSYRALAGSKLANGVNPDTLLYAVKITSLTPLEREYGALAALIHYDLCEEIIKAKISPVLSYSENQIQPLVNTYKLNRGQATAIKSAMDNDAFTLIQGPPGSGKTKTIVALAGALLSNSLAQTSTTTAVALGNNAKRVVNKKLMICAPSNAAVDELVMRLKEGLTTLSGKHEDITIVRLGRSEAINENVKDVTLEELVNAKLKKMAPTGGATDMATLMNQHKQTSQELIQVRDTMDALRGDGKEIPSGLAEEFTRLKRNKQALASQIDTNKDQASSNSREQDVNRRRIQQEVIDSAHIICATLSGSGHEMFQNMSFEFETVIIDEAAQSIELSALIPLKYGCAKCILVGDPKQLPPTVLSREAAKFQYEQSLFVRMQANHPKDVHLLDTQYRMHPEISRFPSQKFYDGRLMDGPDMAKLRRRPWHQNEILGPYRFFDVEGQHASAPQGHSLINIAEINVAMQMYDRVTTDCKGYDFNNKIGIITPYKGQLKELKRRFAQRYGDDITAKVDFNTTDAFQGRECEVIIFSCVRAAPTRGIGFLSDIRRMNVGLTRAKSSLWVLGNSRSLMQGEFWRALIEDARERNVFTHGDGLRLLTRAIAIGLGEVDMDDAPMSDFDEPRIKEIEEPVVKMESCRSSSATIKSEMTDRSKSNTNRSSPLIKKEEEKTTPVHVGIKRKASDSSTSSIKGSDAGGIKKVRPQAPVVSAPAIPVSISTFSAFFAQTLCILRGHAYDNHALLPSFRPNVHTSYLHHHSSTKLTISTAENLRPTDAVLHYTRLQGQICSCQALCCCKHA